MRRLAILGIIVACGGNSQPHELHVMSYAPSGPIDKVEPVEIKFDRPVVTEIAVGRPVDPSAVAVTPAVPWKGYWRDRQTLVVEPTAALAPSTRYEVKLTGTLGAQTGQFTFAFVHKPIEIEGVWGIDTDALAPDGDVPITFNVPVDAAAVQAHCKLTADQGDVGLVAKPQSAATTIALAPATRLEAGRAYTLGCAGLAGVGGNTPLAKPYSLVVHARPVLAVAKLAPQGENIGADAVDLTITFSTPVALDAARKAVKSKPAIPGFAQGTLSSDGTEYKVTADLEVATRYAIKVDSALVDVFGQKLGKPFEATFQTGDAQPRVSMERGIFAVEASAKGYPVWSRNVGTFAVECAQIPRQRLVQILTTDMNYDPWGGNNDGEPIDWAALKVRSRTRTHKMTARNKWLLNELDLGATCGAAPGARGVYLAEVSSDDVQPDPDRSWLASRRNRVLANVTDLGVLIKAGPASGIVWVTSLATGAPVADAKVTVFTPQGKQVFAGASDADGLVKIPGSALLKQQKPTNDNADPEAQYDWDNYRAQRLIATIEKADDLAVVDGNWSNGIQIWNFGLPEDRSGGATRIRGFIQSDRGLYRPGESVHFKGIVREIAGDKPPAIPAKRKVEIEVTDSRGQVVKTTTAKLSSFGGFAFDMNLGAEAALGDYFVAATVAGQVFRERFSVEEFRPASFELVLAARDKTPKPGARLAFDLDAKFLFGAPVANAKVAWNLRKRHHTVRFPGFDDYTFSANPYESWWYRRSDDYGEQVGDGEGTTSAQGKMTIATRDPSPRAAAADGPIDYILTTTVTDPSDQTQSRSTIVTAHKTQLYLGMHANEMVQAVGMPFGVNLVAVKPDGTRTDAKVHLAFVRTVRSCDWQVIAGRAYSRCDAKDKIMIERDVEVAAGGSHTERIYPTEPGDYVVRAEAKDAAGNVVAVASEIWVIGKGEAFWSGDEGDRMTVVASKPTYAPGDTARLVAQANLVAPTTLVTIERDGVIDAKVMKLASATEGVELKIADAWAPNVFASIAMVSGRHGDGDRNRPMFKMGMVELKVASSSKQLDVAVTLDRDHVQPGEPVSGKIAVTHDGKPVRAEVSLSAADEGVLQLIAYETPNPMKTFYASYGLGVDSGTNWNRVARLADPEAGDPDQGGDMRARGDGQRVRSKFLASAYWAPMLVTDEHGEIAFRFTAPDNLTAYRLMAIAADAADQFGAGELRLTIDKPLMALPALPRFMTTGDTASVGAMIENHTDRAGTAVVTVRASGAVVNGAQQSIAVPPNGSARVRFTAKALENAAATFQFDVAMKDDKDAVAVTIPIGKPRVIETRTLVDKTLGAGDAWDGSIGAGDDVLRRESTLVVSVDRSGLGDLAPSLRALVEYPYGCLEQTMSRFIPLVAAKDIAQSLDDPALQGTKAKQFIRAGIAKVIRHQQGDGLFSLWPQSQTYPHLAAYALWGLTVAQQAGEDVPKDVFDRGIAALAQWTSGAGNLKPGGDGAIMAMAAYVMALRGEPDPSLNARLFALRAGLPRWGQAFLLRAMVLAKADASQTTELEQLIVADIVEKDGRATVHETITGDEFELYMTSDVRATAMTLAALLEVDPQSPHIDPLIAGLTASRDTAGRWGTTQDNLWSLVALAQYAKRATAGDATATIKVGDRQLARRRLLGAQVAVLRVPLDKAAGDRVSVAVDHGAHVTVRVTEARLDAGKAESHGYAITRSYQDDAGNELTAIKAGQLVTVKLVIQADADHRWVAVSDPLPAGFEIVNPKLATAQPDPAGQPRRPWWETATWSHSEARDDRQLWFSDQLRAGTYELTYQARATIAGTFTARPATVEAMYHPELHARTAMTTVTIAK